MSRVHGSHVVRSHLLTVLPQPLCSSSRLEVGRHRRVGAGRDVTARLDSGLFGGKAGSTPHGAEEGLRSGQWQWVCAPLPAEAQPRGLSLFCRCSQIAGCLPGSEGPRGGGRPGLLSQRPTPDILEPATLGRTGPALPQTCCSGLGLQLPHWFQRIRALGCPFGSCF